MSIRQIRVRLQSVFSVYQVSEMKDLRNRKICVLLQSKNSNDMEQTVDRTVFNEAQLALLNAFSSLTSEKDLLLLKQAISEFFAKRGHNAVSFTVFHLIFIYCNDMNKESKFPLNCMFYPCSVALFLDY